MNRSDQLRNWAVLPGLILVALANAGAAIAHSPLPKDPCALLKPAEIQSALAPKATIGPGVPATDMAPLGVSCTYTWGPRTSEWGESSVTVTVLDLSKAFPGVSGDQLKDGMMAETMAKDATITASQVGGVGDAGVFKFEARSFNATGEGLFVSKGVELLVKFHGGDVGAKDKVVALLKQAGSRL
jgi:hypothetical protein